jgi:hypothetical protein
MGFGGLLERRKSQLEDLPRDKRQKTKMEVQEATKGKETGGRKTKKKMRKETKREKQRQKREMN